MRSAASHFTSNTLMYESVLDTPLNDDAFLEQKDEMKKYVSTCDVALALECRCSDPPVRPKISQYTSMLGGVALLAGRHA